MHKHKVIGAEDVAHTRQVSIMKYKLGLERRPAFSGSDLDSRYVHRHILAGESDRNLGVFYAMREPDRSHVCVKRVANFLEKTLSGPGQLESQAISEAYILHNILTDHPCVVKLNRVLREAEANVFWLEFEWIGSMSALYTSFDPSETWALLHDAGAALAYCHARGVVHCDVKLDNIMRRGNRFVLIDFGSACFVDNGVAGPKYEVNPVGHRPPETLLGLHWNDRVDVWSLACSAVEFFCAARREPHPFLYDAAASAGAHLLTVARLIGKIPAVMTTHLPAGFCADLNRAACEATGVCARMTEMDAGLSGLIAQMMAPLPQDRPPATMVVMKTACGNKKSK